MTLYCPPALTLMGEGTSVLDTMMEFETCALEGSTFNSGVKLNALGTELVPVPDRVTVEVTVGEALALLEIVSVPLRLPSAVGVKVTLMEHVCPADNVAGQLFV